jgi:hypothetical protein
MKMDAIPAYYEAAKVNIKPNARAYCSWISQNLEACLFFELDFLLAKVN